MIANNSARRQLQLLGITPLAFFTAQAIHYWQIHQLGHMLWMCNIGNLLLALGLFFELPLLIRVAVIWMVPGVAVWFVYVVPTWGMLLTGKFSYTELFGVVSSTLAHLGGFSMGIVVLRKVRMDGATWLYAFVWYFIVQLISRLVTPAAMNVNLAHNIQPGWEQSFGSYLKFWLVLTLLVGICLWALGLLLKILWPVNHASVEDALAS
ncbi:MAG TPA: hypothetical protein VK208_23005 [Pyrinomonadaceae bacterium]|nr:hypothetical protein [Pyrinomonadaceae bacterium]